MKDKRMYRISEEMRRSLSEIIQNRLKDPRIPPLTSVSSVRVTRDLSFATVEVSVLGDEHIREEAIDGLENAKGFLKKELSKEIKIRSMPELLFKLDHSVDDRMNIEKLLHEMKDEDE